MQWSVQKASSAEGNIIYSVIHNGCMYEYIHTPGSTPGLRQWFSDEQGMSSLISGYWKAKDTKLTANNPRETG